MASPSHATYSKSALLGSVVPVIVAIANQRVLADVTLDYDSPLTGLLCVAVLLEITVFGVLSAKHVQPRRVQWLAYAWMWVLLDITVIPLVAAGLWWGNPFALLLPAMLTAQLGVLALWTMLGEIRWPWRALLATAFILLGVVLPLSRHPHGVAPYQVAWLVVPQFAGLALVCGGLRTQGYRLVDGDLREPGSTPTRQFTLFDLLLSMTLLAALLAAARAFDIRLPNLASLRYRSGHDLMLVTGIAAAVTSEAIFWLALGPKRKWRGYLLGGTLILAMIAMAIGILFAVQVYPLVRLSAGNPWRGLLGRFGSTREWAYFFRIRWPLVAWLGLSTITFAAALVFYKMLGYRLCRVRGQSRMIQEIST